MRYFPALKHIRISLILDEASSAWRYVGGNSRKQDARPLNAPVVGKRPAQAAQDTPAPSSSLSRAAEEMRRLTDEYGLAYMASKNIIGPVSILLVYMAILLSADVHATLVSFGNKVGIDTAGAGILAGQVAIC